MKKALWIAFWVITTVGGVVSFMFWGQRNPAGLILWAIGMCCLVASRRMKSGNEREQT